jgi:cytochrome c oxidase subunit 2
MYRPRSAHGFGRNAAPDGRAHASPVIDHNGLNHSGLNRMPSRFAFAFVLIALAVVAGAAGEASAAWPEPWGLGLQDGVTQSMREINDLHNILLYIIVAISVFVLGLLVYVMWRFGEKRNPQPSRTSHNTLIEVLWTVVPVVILVGIAVPSFKLLYFVDTVPKADMTIKAIGHQWYWTYEYPDHNNISFDSVMVPEAEIKAGMRRLLEVDNQVVVPVNATVRVQVTAEDVIHAWAVPAFGVKIDGYPGKLNETWFKAEKEGTYYGQCSELCGTNHGYMPIRVDVVSKEKFDAWVSSGGKRAALDTDGATRVAESAAAGR